RAITLANNIADFLYEREQDARFLSTQTPDVQTYLGFANNKTGGFWTITKEGTESTFVMPIYREIAFLDLNGREQIKVSNECQEYPFRCAMVEDTNLVDTSLPINTLYRSE